MKKLKLLDASGNCGINGLHLVELNVYCDKKITNVSFMKNLKFLDASFFCGIDQNG
jgi:hypothetical protein